LLHLPLIDFQQLLIPSIQFAYKLVHSCQFLANLGDSVGCRHVDFLFLLPLAHAFHQLQVQLLYSNVLFIDDVRAVLHCIFLLSDDLVELLDYKIGALDLFRCLLFLELELFLEHSHVLFIGLQLYLIHILLIVKLGLNLLPLGTGTCFLIFKFFLEFFNLTDL
jgi:hypothetical protein